MKKAVCTAALMLSVLTGVNAQASHDYVPILKDGRQWVYERLSSMFEYDTPYLLHVTVAGDTVVAGKDCKVLDFYVEGDSKHRQCYCYEENHKIYTYQQRNDGYKLWENFFNEGWQAFEINVDLSDEYLEEIAQKGIWTVDVIEIDGKQRYRYGSTHKPTGERYNCVIEGIGSTGNPMGMLPVSAVSDGGYYVLRSCTDQGVELLTGSYFIPQPAAITAVEADENAPVEYFNLQGIRVDAGRLAPGFYIRRQGARSSKVYRP